MDLPPPKLEYAALPTLHFEVNGINFHLAVPAIVPRLESLARIVGGTVFGLLTIGCAFYSLYSWLGPRPDADRAILCAFGIPVFALIAFTLLRGYVRLKRAHNDQVHIRVADGELTVNSLVSADARTISWSSTQVDRVWFDRVGWSISGQRLWRLMVQDVAGQLYLAEFYWRSAKELTRLKTLLPESLQLKPNYDPMPNSGKVNLLFSPRNV